MSVSVPNAEGRDNRLLLTALNEERSVALARYKANRKWVGVAAAVGLLLGLSLTGNILIGVGAAVVIGGLAFVIARWPYSQFNKGLKARLVPRVIEGMGFQYDASAHNFSVSPFRAILPSHDRMSKEDAVSGRVADIDFSAAEVHLEARRVRKTKNGVQTYYVTVFRGRVATFKVPKNFTCTVRVGQNVWDMLGNLGNLFSDMKQVKLEDPDFENMFDVYSDNQVEARYILTPTMMERLKKLKMRSGSLQALFCSGSVHLAIPSSYNLFENGYTGNDLTDESLLSIENDMQMISDIAHDLGLTLKTRI